MLPRQKLSPAIEQSQTIQIIESNLSLCFFSLYNEIALKQINPVDQIKPFQSLMYLWSSVLKTIAVWLFSANSREKAGKE